MSSKYIESVSDRYIELYEKILGKEFIKEDTSNILQRVEDNILEYLNK